MSNHVDQITIEVSDIDDIELSIRAFELRAAINSIPTISLDILPIEKPTGGEGVFTTASAPEIKEMTDLYTKLMGKAVALETKATITITETLSCEGEKSEKKLELKDWLLTDVGLSSITAYSAPILTATFSHPAVMLDKSGYIYEKLASDNKIPGIFEDMDADNTIGLMDQVYDKFAGDALEFYEFASIPEGGTQDQYEEKVRSFRKDLQTFSPGKYLQSDGIPLFMTTVEDSISDKITMAIASMMMPAPFGESTWQRIISSISPNLLMQVVPTYDLEKLTLEPFNPWQTFVLNVFSQRVEAINMTTMDPNPIIGTAVDKTVFSGGASYDSQTREDNDTGKDNSYTFYFPPKVISDNIKGTIRDLGDPAIVRHILAMDIGGNASMDGQTAEDPEDAVNGVTEEIHESMSETYAKAVFQSEYRRGCKASVVTIPMFSDRYDTMIYPGRTALVSDDKTGDHLFIGYISDITIHGNIDGGGNTLINFIHARPPDGSVLVEEGAENPCYAKK